MRIEERIERAKDYINMAKNEIFLLQKNEEMTQDVYSIVREHLGDASRHVYQSTESGLRTDRKRWCRQSAVFSLSEAYSVIKETNPDTDARLRIFSAIESFIV
ncbi:MAG: hypothetical protein GOVbin2729_46 [Prokaryotic dsDNA virus sp.]|nr:MAG: hypothetical protein GOVbin2729_46 [Prokaryotic dsDNA virus sp.]|tara:strand:- start:287 stop:595 length:309 start_codon:yes stop_codon:yes gene_type:complete